MISRDYIILLEHYQRERDAADQMQNKHLRHVACNNYSRIHQEFKEYVAKESSVCSPGA